MRPRKPIAILLSCDGLTESNIWMTEPMSALEKLNFKYREKKQKERVKERGGGVCQQSAKGSQPWVLLLPSCKDNQKEGQKGKKSCGWTGRLHSLQ
jgi:hypothetical protein